MLEEFVYVDGKKYRRGYTTGSCAAAVCKACMYMFFNKKVIDKIEISTPKNISLSIDVYDSQISENSVSCRVVKDGGDDIDATHKMDIYAKLDLIDKSMNVEYKCDIDIDNVEVTAGVGIGKVTRKGLSTEVGRPAINPVPLSMIKKEVEEVMDSCLVDVDEFLGSKKILLTIYAPDGETVAKNTFNANLGIQGGISIIGTTGIVEPMSDEGWKKALSSELSIKKAEGVEHIVLTPGNIGYEIMVSDYGCDPNSIVKMSNFIGYMLMESKRYGFKKITIAGHIGKLIKLSGGITNTHSRVSDARREIMVANLALMGCDIEILKKIDSCLTTDAMIPIISENKLEKVYDILCEKAAKKAWTYLREGKEEIEIEVKMFSMEKEILGEGSYNTI